MFVFFPEVSCHNSTYSGRSALNHRKVRSSWIPSLVNTPWARNEQQKYHNHKKHFLLWIPSKVFSKMSWGKYCMLLLYIINSDRSWNVSYIHCHGLCTPFFFRSFVLVLCIARVPPCKTVFYVKLLVLFALTRTPLKNISCISVGPYGLNEG